MLYKVTFKEDKICGKTVVQIVKAKDKSKAQSNSNGHKRCLLGYMYNRGK